MKTSAVTRLMTEGIVQLFFLRRCKINYCDIALMWHVSCFQAGDARTVSLQEIRALLGSVRLDIVVQRSVPINCNLYLTG